MPPQHCPRGGLNGHKAPGWGPGDDGSHSAAVPRGCRAGGQHRIHRPPPRRSHHRGAAAVLHHRAPLLDDLRTSSRSCAHNTSDAALPGGSGRLPSPPLRHGLAAPQGSPALRRAPCPRGLLTAASRTGGATSSTQRCRAHGGGNGAALLSPTGLGDVMGAHTAPWSSGSPPSLNSGKNSPSCAPDVLQAAPGHHLHPITHSPTTPPSNSHLTAPQPWHPVWESARGATCCAGTGGQTHRQHPCATAGSGDGGGLGDTGWAPWGCRGRRVPGSSSAAPTAAQRCNTQDTPHGCASVSPQLPEQHSLQAQQHGDSSRSHRVTQRSSRGN